MAKLRRGDRPGHHQFPLHPLRPGGLDRAHRPARARADHARRPGGSSTTRPRSGSACARSSTARWPARPRRRVTWRPSGSPTSARPRWCGTARPASRCTTPSSGRTRAPRRWCASWRATRAWTGCGTWSACRCRPTSPGPKLKWILDNVDGARERAEAGELAFGTMDTWVLWNLTGGADGGVHATDVTNASRTLLMDLETLDWHQPALELMGIPASMLPEIRSSSEPYGEAKGTALGGRPVAGILGDQQAALFGQTCFEKGEAKNTYGTGSFLLVNTGEEIAHTEKLLTTLAYKLGDEPARYALEGSIAVTGALIQWLRDRLKIIPDAPAVEELARTRGRQRRRVLRAGVLGPVRAPLARRRPRRDLRADGVLEPGPHRPRGAGGRGVAVEGGGGRRERRGRRALRRAARGRRHDRQRAADAVPGRRAGRTGDPARRSPRPPPWARPTRRGWRRASGADRAELKDRWAEDKRWEPQMDADERERGLARWRAAVERSLGWEQAASRQRPQDFTQVWRPQSRSCTGCLRRAHASLPVALKIVLALAALAVAVVAVILAVQRAGGDDADIPRAAQGQAEVMRGALGQGTLAGEVDMRRPSRAQRGTDDPPAAAGGQRERCAGSPPDRYPRPGRLLQRGGRAWRPAGHHAGVQGRPEGRARPPRASEPTGKTSVGRLRAATPL